MNKINKKGFTLVELLAVIVVLAIVMVLATTTILPYLSDSRKTTFAVEANEARNAAADAITLIQIGTISDIDGNYAHKGTGTSTDPEKYCFTLTNLTKLGLWTKNDAKYVGRVVATKDGKVWKYAVNLKNDELYVSVDNKDAKKEDAKSATGDKTNSIKFDCSSY